MATFKLGDIVEVNYEVSEGWFGGYRGGDSGVVTSTGCDFLYVNFGDYRDCYKVLKREVSLLDPSITPVIRRIRSLHKRQSKHPYLTKEYSYG